MKNINLKPKLTSPNVSFCPQHQIYSVYCHRGENEPENIHIYEAGIRIKTFFSPFKLIEYQNSWCLIQLLTTNQWLVVVVILTNHWSESTIDLFNVMLWLISRTVPDLSALLRGDSVSAVDSRRGDGSVALLSRRVPDLSLYRLAVHLDAARGELHPDGALTL